MAQQSWNRLDESNQMWAVIKWSAGVVTSGHKDLGTKSETKTQNFPTFCVGSILTDFSNNSAGCWAAPLVQFAQRDADSSNGGGMS